MCVFNLGNITISQLPSYTQVPVVVNEYPYLKVDI